MKGGFFGTLRELRAANDLPLLRAVVKEAQGDPDLDEMAFPAYFRGNPASRAVFFGRLAAFLALLPDRAEGAPPEVLDFGCGLGLVSALFAARGERVTCVDLFPQIAREYLARRGLPARFLPSLEEAEERRFDRILLLDVLEHHPDPAAAWRRVALLLAPGGVALLSGPTENLLYRAGRRVVGFSGDYHRWTVADILRMGGEAGLGVTRERAWPLPGPFRLFTGAVLTRR